PRHPDPVAGAGSASSVHGVTRERRSMERPAAIAPAAASAVAAATNHATPNDERSATSPNSKGPATAPTYVPVWVTPVAAAGEVGLASTRARWNSPGHAH